MENRKRRSVRNLPCGDYKLNKIFNSWHGALCFVVECKGKLRPEKVRQARRCAHWCVELWTGIKRRGGTGAADKASFGPCGESLYGIVSCGGAWFGRLGKFCCVDPGPGSARTGKVRFGRHGELRKVCSGQPQRGTVWYGRRGGSMRVVLVYGAQRHSTAGKRGLVVDWYCKLTLGKAGMAGEGNSRSVVVRNGQFR